MDHGIRQRVEKIKAQLATDDPDVLEAATEVDPDLLSWTRSLTPRARLRACTQAARSIDRIRRGAPAGS